MKLFHLSDLHLGKRVNDFSMLDEQEAILKQIIDYIKRESPDGVLIAGDIYDKSIPSAEAVQLFDNFLVELAKLHLQVFIISGNHDSPERIAFGSRIMDVSGIHLSPVYNGEIAPISLSDEYGAVNIYMLPFIKPAHVRRYFEDEDIVTYTDAMKVAIDKMAVDETERNILVTHQFVTGAATCESEDISVGGTDNVDASVFSPFDYVALGHIHGAQNCGDERIRYCGTPLKYSFSEVHHQKSITVVELGAKGDLNISTIELTPVHDMSEIKGTFAELTDPVYYTENSIVNNYLRITLTDEEDVPDAIGRLRQIYKNLMRLDYDNTRTRSNTIFSDGGDTERKTPFDLFSEFYEMQNNAPMSEEQREYMKKLIEKIEEEIA
ncbi:MAG: exonuclease SbcCD subunit D [Clostridia bacterium]|nr:exonuclease SbcCD subunit D [Clostridia bacterium]